MTELSFDFSNAPPKQGGGGLTLVPNGPYKMVVTDCRHEESSKGNPMVVVEMEICEGPYFGETFTDYFSPVPAPPNADSKKMRGTMKFHAFLLALGFQLKGPKGRLQLETLIKRKCIANVRAKPLDPTDEYPEPRDVSKIFSYELPTPGTAPKASSNGQSGAAVAAAPAPAPAAVAEPEPEAVAVAAGASDMSVDTGSDDDDDIFK